MTTSKRPSDAEPGDPRGHEATLAASLRKDQVRAALFGAPTTRKRIGRYVVEEVLGEGAMGTVFLGFDPQLDRHVAIKQIKGDDDEARRARMLREAQALARLSHPNVVPVYEVGEHEGRLFFAMERVKGTSLHAWQQAQDHGWRTVVEHYIQAGRGLAAAHAVGLVHRDFKPHNAVVGDDGRVRVLDFGVAGTDRQRAAVDEADVTASATDSKQDWIRTPLTSTGAVVGTPAYMAPEQLHGSEVSHHADQYAFCVAVYEGLYGERPIDMAGVRRMLAGDRIEAAPPAGTAVPRRVWATLQRGLSPEPEARFESMDALLVALDPSRARRRRVVMTVGVVGTGLLGALAMAGDREQPCLPDPTALADAWNDERRTEIREAFAATDLPFADTTADYAEQTLQSWSDAWVQARSDACRAARVDQVETEARMEARMACLERQRQVLGAHTEVLAEADGKTVGRADEVLAGLPDVAACAQSELVDDRYPRPADPDVRAQIDEVYRDLARARAMAAAGDRREALLLATEIRERAAALPYPPAELEAEWRLATFALDRGGLDEAVPRAMAIAWRAETLHLDDLVAKIRLRVAEDALGIWSRPEQEDWLLAGAEASVARSGRDRDPRHPRLMRLRARQEWRSGKAEDAIVRLADALGLASALEDPALEILLRLELGAAHLAAHHFEEARAELEHARETAVASVGPRSHLVAEVERTLALVALENGEQFAAQTHSDRALAIYAATLGADSVGAARATFIQTKLLMNRGAFGPALESVQRVLLVYEDVLGAEARETGEAYGARGVLRFYLGEYEESVSDYRRARDVLERANGPRDLHVALMTSNIAESQLQLRNYDAALAGFDDALATMRTARGADDPLLALPYKGRGLTLVALGRSDEGIASLEKAVSIHAASNSEPLERAMTRYALARAVATTDPERARSLAHAAEAELKELRATDHAHEIRDWISNAKELEQ